MNKQESPSITAQTAFYAVLNDLDIPPTDKIKIMEAASNWTEAVRQRTVDIAIGALHSKTAA